mmetsp:Transcript_20353/g.51561  ORF Transcript_20353/g.51561 Transcript_20353/m.51561 type:complete len:455 (-) Transcript_20353:87-1451(-)
MRSAALTLPPVSICLSSRNSLAASRMREKLMQKDCTSCSRSCMLIMRLRMRDWRNTHTRRTSRFCTYLSCVFSHELMQLVMYRCTNSCGRLTAVVSRLTTSMLCRLISVCASTARNACTRGLRMRRISSSYAITGVCSTSRGRCRGASPSRCTNRGSASSSASTACCCAGSRGPRSALLSSSRTAAPRDPSSPTLLSHTRCVCSSGPAQASSSTNGVITGGAGRAQAGSNPLPDAPATCVTASASCTTAACCAARAACSACCASGADAAAARASCTPGSGAVGSASRQGSPARVWPCVPGALEIPARYLCSSADSDGALTSRWVVWFSAYCTEVCWASCARSSPCSSCNTRLRSTGECVLAPPAALTSKLRKGLGAFAARPSWLLCMIYQAASLCGSLSNRVSSSSKTMLQHALNWSEGLKAAWNASLAAWKVTLLEPNKTFSSFAVSTRFSSC